MVNVSAVLGNGTRSWNMQNLVEVNAIIPINVLDRRKVEKVRLNV